MTIDWARVSIFVRPGPTDMRKEINGLAVLVEEELACDPFSARSAEVSFFSATVDAVI